MRDKTTRDKVSFAIDVAILVIVTIALVSSVGDKAEAYVVSIQDVIWALLTMLAYGLAVHGVIEYFKKEKY